mgnify:CR=1 FL=1
MSKEKDEYVWSDYPQEYSDQLVQISREDNMDFFIEFDENGDIKNEDRLHPNWKELYWIVNSLKPKSVFECGMGAGYHAANIRAMCPETEIFGCDLLPEQLEKAKEFSKLPQDIIDNVRILDFTKENDLPERAFEFVYSMAVVMHLSTENARLFLRNMGKISKKYIFMVEGIKNHENWFEMVKETLPEFDFEVTNQYVDNGILLTRKENE